MRWSPVFDFGGYRVLQPTSPTFGNDLGFDDGRGRSCRGNLVSLLCVPVSGSFLLGRGDLDMVFGEVFWRWSYGEEGTRIKVWFIVASGGSMTRMRSQNRLDDAFRGKMNWRHRWVRWFVDGTPAKSDRFVFSGEKLDRRITKTC
ncbi:Uncharacterized protein Rs2_17118 [Raphanus sativus]|nr:Uncharacterized protein Rs2_17118 [Raphanus sativus]